MSRIEKAMEIASQLRQSNTAPAQSRKHAFGDNVIHTPPPMAEVAVKITSDNPFLVTLNDPHSHIAEEYRKLKSVLVKMTSGDNVCRNMIMVTSAVPNEGKTITALNLAVSLAQEFDHTVLLVDADLRRPSLNRYLNIKNTPGLADCLQGGVNLGETIIRTGIGKLSVIPAGCEVSNPAELFSSSMMKDLIEEMKYRYKDRYIIFDTPPILPFAETRSLAHLVDEVLFVVKERLASQTNIRDAVEALKECHLLGMVYNDSSSEQHGQSYYYHSGYASKVA